MNTIIIEGPNKALEAGAWVNVHIRGNWNVDIADGPFSSTYVFSFEDAEDATHFALRWR